MDSKKVVALSDDALDEVSGGLIVNSTYVRNENDGVCYRLLVDKWAAYGYVNELGMVSEEEKIAALQAAGMIGERLG